MPTADSRLDGVGIFLRDLIGTPIRLGVFTSAADLEQVNYYDIDAQPRT
jgi:hypothetical protein